MKAFLLTFLATIIGITTFSQSPTTFNYQAVLRDASGQVLANQDVEIGIALLQGSATGSEVFTETHSVTTNSYGLVNLQIGSVNTAEMQTIDWSEGPFFIEISVDGTIMGTSQLLSVPFAMHAITVENDAIKDDDADPENEIQVLSIHADTILLSSGGFVVLPPETDPAFTNWDKRSGISISEAQISDLKHFTGDSITGYETAFEGWDKDVSDDFTTADETDPIFANSLAAAINAADTAMWAKDTDPQNELQKLSLENQLLSISNGNTIDLSSALVADSSASKNLQDISLNGTLLSITKGSTVDLAEIQDGDKQRLSLGVSNQHEIRLNISNANFVEMPFVKDGVSKYNWDEAENYVARWGQYGSMGKSTIYDNGNVGIGTETPEAKLEVAGQIKITGGEPGNNKILVSDNNGLATWKPNLDNDPTNELQILSISNDTIYLSDGGKVKLPAETDPLFSNWDKSTGIEITESQITDLDHFTNADEIDPVYAADSASLKTAISKNQQAIIDTASLLRSDLATKVALADTATLLHSETAQNKQAIIDTAAQIRAEMFTTELDPFFSNWDKSTGITITESQITDLKHFTGDSITGNEIAFDGWDKNASDDFDGQYSSLSGAPQNVSAFNNDTGYITSPNDADADPTNELELPSQAGNSGKYLTTNGSTTSWSTVSTGSNLSLDDAYNNGRTITADAGPFQVTGTDGVVFTGTYDSGSIPATGSGTRMMWYPKRGAFRAGRVYSSQWDDSNIGDYSVAFGLNTRATGDYTLAMGYNSLAKGFCSHALGYDLIATNYCTAIGRFNVEDNNNLFVVGNGSTNDTRRNAFAVDVNGDVIAYNNLKAKELYTKFGGESDTYYLLQPWLVVVGGMVVGYSDENLKENIETIKNPLEQLELLRGVTYDWNQTAKNYFVKDVEKSVVPGDSHSDAEKEEIWEKERQRILDDADRNTMNFVAQEVEEYFPQWVKEDDNGYKTVDMKGLNSLLVEAVKELKSEKDADIKELKQTIENLQNANMALKAENGDIKQRLEILEALVKNTLNGLTTEKASAQK